eukprot:192607_1
MSGIQDSKDGQERDRKRPRMSPSSSPSDKDEGDDPKNLCGNKAGDDANESAENQNAVSIAPGAYEDILEQFECPICNISMFDGPIPQCPAGHIICEKCKEKLPEVKKCPQCRRKLGDIRCRVLETMAQKMPMPCKNKRFGCQLIIQPSERSSHKNVCEFTPLQCPYSYRKDHECQWEGNVQDLDNHWKTEHGKAVHQCVDSVEKLRQLKLSSDPEDIFANNDQWSSLLSLGDHRFCMMTRFAFGRLHIRTLHLGKEGRFVLYRFLMKVILN